MSKKGVEFKVRPVTLMTLMALTMILPQASAESIGKGGTADKPVVLDQQAYESRHPATGYYHFTHPDAVTITGELSDYWSHSAFRFDADANMTLKDVRIYSDKSSASLIHANKNLTLTTGYVNAIRATKDGQIDLSANDTLQITLTGNAVLSAESGANSLITLTAKNIEISSPEGQNAIYARDGSDVKLTASDRIQITGNVHAFGVDAPEKSTVRMEAQAIEVAGTVEAAENSSVSLIADQGDVKVHDVVVSSGSSMVAQSNSGLSITNGLLLTNDASKNYLDPTQFVYKSQTGKLSIAGVADGKNYSITIGDNGGGPVEFVASAKTIDVAKGIYIDKPKSVLSLTDSDLIHIGASDVTGKAIHADWLSKTTLAASQLNIDGNVEAVLGANLTLKGNNLQLQGNITSTDNALVDVTGGKGSIFTGSISDGLGQGKVNLTFSEGGLWNVTDSSALTQLSLTNSTLDFGYQPNAGTKAGPAYRAVNAAKFVTDGSTLAMRIDLGAEDVQNKALDTFNISGAATGTANVQLDIVGKALAEAADKTHSVNALISQGEGSKLTLTNKDGDNAFSGRGMVKVWRLGFVGQDQEHLLDTEAGLAQIGGQTTGNGAGDWYLVNSTDPNQMPQELQDNAVFGTSAAQAMGWLNDNETLRQRIGEVRHGLRDGAWVRVDAQKDRFGTGFKQKTYGLMVGYDTLTQRQNNSTWLFGGAFRYANADQEGLGLSRATGELNQYAAKVYATWMHDQGSYADIVLQVGRYDQTISGLDNLGTDSAKADYNTYGYGASLEVGHQFLLDNMGLNHWFVEPQIELSYFYAKGDAYATSTGLKVDQGNADFLNGRFGVVVGKTYRYGSADDNRYVQLGFTGGINHEFLGDQTIRYTGTDGKTLSVKANGIDGTRFYYGLTADWQCTDRLRAYATLEREEGDDYTQAYDFNIGLKYSF